MKGGGKIKTDYSVGFCYCNVPKRQGWQKRIVDFNKQNILTEEKCDG